MVIKKKQKTILLEMPNFAHASVALMGCFAALQNVAGNNVSERETSKLLIVGTDPECLRTFNPIRGSNPMSDNLVELSDPLLSRKEAAYYLSERGLTTAPQTLARKFHEGAGPLCTHLGHRAMYRQSHLDAYFSEQLSTPRNSSSQPRQPMPATVAVSLL